VTVDLTRTIRITDLTDDEQDSLNELILQWRQKRPRNNLRSAFYDMTNSERTLMSGQVPAVIRRRKFVLGWSAIAVDKLNRRCNLNGIYDGNNNDLDSLGLPDLIRSNRLMGEISRAGLSSLKHSVAWLVTTQGDTDAGEPVVLINARDAATATGMWDVRRRALRSFLSITALNDDGEPTEMTMHLDNLNVLMSKEDGAWKVDRNEHTYGVPVDPLVYKADVDRPFGRSRISRSVMSIHMQALGAMIRADVNGEAYSLSRYVLLGATEEAFKNADGSPKPAWQAAWDAVWAVGDDDDANVPRADVKRFSGESPEPQLAHLRMLAQMFSGETGIPTGELGIFADSNPTSADSLTIGKDDLFAEAEQTTDGWSPDISSAITRALTMLNGDVPANLDIREDWRNPRFVSRAAEADSMSKIVDKFPWLAETEVGLELGGLSPGQIRRALAERQRAQGRAVLDRLTQRTASAGEPVADNIA
jgi:hypothetical protein